MNQEVEEIIFQIVVISRINKNKQLRVFKSVRQIRMEREDIFTFNFMYTYALCEDI